MSTGDIAVDIGLVVLGISFALSAVRIAIGPTRADRVVGTDLCFFLLVGIVGLISIRLDAPAYLDVVLVAAVVGFLSTVVLTLLIDRRES